MPSLLDKMYEDGKYASKKRDKRNADAAKKKERKRKREESSNKKKKRKKSLCHTMTALCIL